MRSVLVVLAVSLAAGCSSGGSSTSTGGSSATSGVGLTIGTGTGGTGTLGSHTTGGSSGFVAATGPYRELPDGGGLPSMTCAGTVDVDGGWLAGGQSSMAVSSSAFTPQGIRLILAPTAAQGCDIENHGYDGSNPTGLWGSLELTLAPSVGPGTYPLGEDGTPDIHVTNLYTSDGTALNLALQSGTLVLSSVSQSSGLVGSYDFHFGAPPSGGAGSTDATSAATTSGGGTVTSPASVEEVGTFNAPVCELCPSPPGCAGGPACAADQLCIENGTGCVPGPICSGAASCEGCGPNYNWCSCAGYDGLNLFCAIHF